MTAAEQQMRSAFDGLVSDQQKAIAEANQSISEARRSIKAAKKEIKRLVGQRARVLGATDSPAEEEGKGVAA